LIGLCQLCQFGAGFFFLARAQFVHCVDKFFALQICCGLHLIVIDDPASKGQKSGHHSRQKPAAITRPKTAQVTRADGIIDLTQKCLVATAPVFIRGLFSRCQSQKGLRICLVKIGQCRP
jgi:hypothetical protein